VRYLVNVPIDGVRIRDGRHEEVHLDAGAVFTLSRAVHLNSRLIEAIWDGDFVLLFANDLDTRCERISG
jgi:hypothetical protein